MEKAEETKVEYNGIEMDDTKYLLIDRHLEKDEYSPAYGLGDPDHEDTYPVPANFTEEELVKWFKDTQRAYEKNGEVYTQALCPIDKDGYVADQLVETIARFAVVADKNHEEVTVREFGTAYDAERFADDLSEKKSDAFMNDEKNEYDYEDCYNGSSVRVEIVTYFD